MPPLPPGLHHDGASRYSKGGTALDSYDRFSVGVFANLHHGSDDNDDHIAGVNESSAVVLPPATRLLMLEEKLRESERQNQALRRQMSHLRQSLAPPHTVSTSCQTESTHPCFGELLADLGHKRIYRASARQLVNTVPIWGKQRACNEGRVDEIVRAKSHQPSLMGPVMCFEFKPSEFDTAGLAMPSLTRPQPRAIFDGQHRARAAMRLLSSEAFTIDDEAPTGLAAGVEVSIGCQCTTGGERPKRSTTAGVASIAAAKSATSTATAATLRGGQFHDFDLVVEVYPVDTEREIKELYLEVNKAESVKEIDLPDAIAPQKKAHIDTAVERLRGNFPEMFKPSERCRPPHLHRDTLRNKLFHHAATTEVTNADGLYARFEQVNQRLAARPLTQWPERLRKPLEKATAHGLFLGLDDYAWLDWL